MAQRTQASGPSCPQRVLSTDLAPSAVPQVPGTSGSSIPAFQGPRSPVVTYLQDSSPMAGSEVSTAARRFCSSRNRPRALPPWPGPLAGAPPGGRTLLPPHLFLSFFSSSPGFSPSIARRLPGLPLSGLACALNTFQIDSHPNYRCGLLCGMPTVRQQYAKRFTLLIPLIRTKVGPFYRWTNWSSER